MPLASRDSAVDFSALANATVQFEGCHFPRWPYIGTEIEDEACSQRRRDYPCGVTPFVEQSAINNVMEDACEGNLYEKVSLL